MTQGFSSRFKRSFNAFIRTWQAHKANAKRGGAFEPLTPVLLEGKQADRYESELLHALEDEQVRNIAITGGYGAGKSSVIRTFFDRHPEYSNVFVSLATFSKEVPTQADEAQAADPDLMSRIEETIVQQLLYAVPAQQLPKTRLKRIVQASNTRIAFHTVFFTLLTVCGLRLYLPSVKNLPAIDPDWLIPGLMLLPDWLALIFAGAAGVYLLYSTLKYLSLFSIDGLTLKGGKLEATHYGSVLHKHVDEIVYCFERSAIDVVVIEDLDRFGIQDVFFRLREINFTLRQSPQIQRPVHFIYAIRDELFSVGDKTKFFDLIIPVIPVVNSENSREKMMGLLNAGRFDAATIGRLDRELIETVCYYIDEMRLIKNIVNEFDIFSGLLGGRGVKLEVNKLFAMVVVRNLYPEAYADLIKRRGKIFSVLSEFGGWRIERANQFEAEIKNLRDHLADMEREHLASVEELRVSVWYQIVKSIHPANASELKYDAGRTVTLTEFVQEAVFEDIFKKNRTLSIEGLNPDSLGVLRKTVESEQVLTLTSYRARALRLAWEPEALMKQVEVLRNKSTLTKRTPFRVAAKLDYGEVLAQKLKGLEAVTYLMRTGYFDTDYNDYLGFFYEGSLTQDDKNLILALRRGESPGVMTIVNDPAKVLGKLDHEVLEDGRGLIAGLVDYLCSQYTAADDGLHVGKLDAILDAAPQFLQRFADVVDSILPSQNVSTLIQFISQSDPGLFEKLLLTSRRFEESGPRQALLCSIFNSLPPEQVAEFEDCELGILEGLAGLTDVSQVVPLLAEGKATWGWLRKQDVQFHNLSDTTSPDDLKQLLSFGCVAPQLNMLRLICSTFETEDGDETLVTYRRLLALRLDGIDTLLTHNRLALVKQLLSQDGPLDESAESLGALLTAARRESELMVSLLERTTCQFETLDSVPSNAWSLLLEADRVSGKAQAVWACLHSIIESASSQFVYPRTTRINGEKKSRLNTFIERNVETLLETLWTLHPDQHGDLQKYLLRETAISNDTLSSLLSTTTLSSIDVLDSVPQARWGMLVTSSFLPYSEEISNVVQSSANLLDAEYFERRKVTTDTV